jgi:hypothetical protein
VASQLEQGLLAGLLVGEGHFGGDGRQPQITLRMHVRHESLFRWLERTFPGGRLYGPYSHDGRHYFQWMVRGTYLRDEILPMLELTIRPELDAHTHARLEQMKARYPGRLQRTVTPDSARDVQDPDVWIDYVTARGTDVIDPHATTETGD